MTLNSETVESDGVFVTKPEQNRETHLQMEARLESRCLSAQKAHPQNRITESIRQYFVAREAAFRPTAAVEIFTL